jgi:hypothetical protein
MVNWDRDTTTFELQLEDRLPKGCVDNPAGGACHLGGKVDCSWLTGQISRQVLTCRSAGPRRTWAILGCSPYDVGGQIADFDIRPLGGAAQNVERLIGPTASLRHEDPLRLLYDRERFQAGLQPGEG